MKRNLPILAAASVLMAAASLPAQTTGTAHPEDLGDSISVATPQSPIAKPSPAVPYSAPAPILRTHDVDNTVAAQPAPIVETAQATSHSAPLSTTDDINSGIVTEVPAAENEVPEGTLLRVTLDNTISTQTTIRGAAFHAELTQDIARHGKVVVPAGTMLSGQVSQLHGGPRISGAAIIHLKPEFLTLPDGTTYKLDAQVIDLAHHSSSHVSEEGTIIGNDHSKGTMAALGLTTASAAAAGAMIGGGAGALVGAGVGAGVGTVWWLKHENQQTLPKGTEIIFSLNRPMLLENVTN